MYHTNHNGEAHVLPLVVIGATEEIQARLMPGPLAEVVSFHPTAEAAFRDLLERVRVDHVTMDESPLAPKVEGWPVNVAYGPLAFGGLAMGRVGSVSSTRLPHTGHTFVLAFEVDPDPGAPRAVSDGQVSDVAEDRSAWQAAVVVSADLMIDVAKPDALTYLANYLESR